MTLLKNVADSPRGIHTLSGFVLIDAGETREVELSPAERSGLGSYFRVVKPDATPVPAQASQDGDGRAQGGEGSGDARSAAGGAPTGSAPHPLPEDRDALVVVAESMGLKVHPRAGAARIRAQIEEARAKAGE